MKPNDEKGFLSKAEGKIRIVTDTRVTGYAEPGVLIRQTLGTCPVEALKCFLIEI
jgi:hypothetical protein